MKTILIINLHSTQNAGDHALLQMSLQDLRARFPQCDIVLAANDPNSFLSADERQKVVASFFYWMQGLSPKRPTQLFGVLRLFLGSLLAALSYRLTGRAILWPIPAVQRQSVKAYLDAGVVASCPGNFLYSRTYQAGLPLLVTIYTIAYAWLVGKPIFMLPQTIGPIWRKWERLVLTWLLRRTQTILLRDALSLELVGGWGVPASRCHLLADMAFQPTQDEDGTGARLLCQFGLDPDTQRPRLGVTVINWGAQDPSFHGQEVYEATLAATIQHFIQEQNGYVVLFAQVCGPKSADDDRIPARRVAQLLAGTPVASRIVVADDIFPPDLLRAAYAQMDLFIGSRLHSNIFALCAGVPVVAIAYQIKTWGVMQMLGLQEWVIDIDRVDGGRLAELCSQIWLRRSALRAQIPARIAALIDERRAILRSVYGEMAVVLEKKP